jgi:hypothetical protein
MLQLAQALVILFVAYQSSLAGGAEGSPFGAAVGSTMKMAPSFPAALRGLLPASSNRTLNTLNMTAPIPKVQGDPDYSGCSDLSQVSIGFVHEAQTEAFAFTAIAGVVAFVVAACDKRRQLVFKNDIATLLIAVFAAVTPPLCVALVDNKDENGHGIPFMSQGVFACLCGSSLALGLALWTFRPGKQSNAWAVAAFSVWCLGTAATAVVPFLVQTEVAWLAVAGGFLVAHVVLAAVVLFRVVDKDKLGPRNFFAGLLVATLLLVHFAVSKEMVDAREFAAARFPKNGAAGRGAIFTVERLYIPPQCCVGRAGLTEPSERDNFVISCSLREWGKAVNGTTYLNERPTMVVGDVYSAQTLVLVGAVFFLLTAMGHFYTGCRMRKSEYPYGLTPARWAEYYVTASMMMFVLAVLGPVVTGLGVQVAVLMTAATMTCGYLVEHDIANPEEGVRLKASAGYASVETMRHASPSASPETGGITDTTTKWEATVIGWVLFLSLWIVLGFGFDSAFRDIQVGAPERSVPEFVVAIIVTTGVAFGCFGFIQIAHLVAEDKGVRVEYAYSAASASAKTVLVWLLIGGTLRGED